MEIRCVIEYTLRGFGESLFSQSDFLLQIVGNVILRNGSNLVGRDPLSLHTQNPVINRELVVLLLDQLGQLLFMQFVQHSLPLQLNLHDAPEGFLWFE